MPPAEVKCLEIVVEHETTGKLSNGADKVAMVVINRANSPGFPNTFCEVVYQRSQFTNVHKTKRAGIAAQQVVEDVLNGTIKRDPLPLYFHTSKVKPSWASRVRKLYQIGVHIFYGK